MSLSSLIVERGIATIREMEEALARQVLYGGDFVTNLFEVSRVEEAALMPVVAESYGLTAAPPGELPKADPAAHRLVPVDVIRERMFAPISAGETLVVAVSEPLSKDAEQELTFALAVSIEQRIAPLFRIRQALARDYGIPIDKRIARLIQKIVTKGPIMASTFPPPIESAPKIRVPPRPPSMIPPAVASAVTAPPPQKLPMPQGTFLRNAEAAGLGRPTKRRRGPLTLAGAIEQLEASVERDAIFDILFEFARQFFDYTALFVVHGEKAEGRDAFGDGASRDRVARLSVPLEPASLLGAAHKAKAAVRLMPEKVGLDPVLMGDLGRDGTTECVVFPIVVRTRVVAIILGDGGSSGIEDLSVKNVESLMQSAAGAFERVIMRRKLKGDTGNDSPKPPEQAPPTQASASEARVSAEELAAPIREIMMEPPSKRNIIRLEEPPTIVTVTPAPAPVAPAAEALRRTQLSNELPSPISSVRPEPESTSSSRGPTSNAPRRRGQAPPLEFGRAIEPRIISESKRPDGPIVHVHHERAPSINEAVTAPPPSLGPAANVPSVPPPTVPDPNARFAEERNSHSPKALSPPPMRVAPITDLSLKPIVIGPISEMVPNAPAPPAEAPAARTVVSGLPTFEDEEHPSLSKMVVQSLEKDDAPLFDPDATPQAPTVIGPEDETPAAPRADSMQPVLSLTQRKVHIVPPPAPVVETKPMPPSEEQISVGPHTPPSSHSDHSRVLPSVIVDVSTEYVALVDRVIAGDDEEAEAQLLRAGGYAMPAIMAKFPGPLDIDRALLDEEPLPRVADCGPVIRLIASQRRTALPFVLAHVEAPDAESRFWATYLLTELIYPDAIDAAVARAFDTDARVRRAARAAVHALAEALPQPVVERLGEFTLAQTPELRIRAIEALAESREATAVQVLLPLLEENSGEVVAATQKALVAVTRQDFGLEQDRWIKWWDQNKSRHRIEWLIDALNHDQRRMRSLASEELKQITKESFGYYDDLPRRERERAQQKFREWWDAIGRVRFSRASTRGA